MNTSRDFKAGNPDRSLGPGFEYMKIAACIIHSLNPSYSRAQGSNLFMILKLTSFTKV
jgi:hypothetical protein